MRPHKLPNLQKMTPLIEAIVRGDSLNQIKSLFAAGKVKNINEKDEYGDTALSIAEGLDREPEIINFLKKQGAR